MKVKGLAGLADLRARVPDATAPVAGHDALEAAIAEAPEDAASYLVYADALAAANDPRGAFITLHERGTPEEVRAYLDAHRPYLLGSLVTYESEYTATWFMGFIRALVLTPKTTARALELLAIIAVLPACRFLCELVIEPPKRFELAAVVDKLAALGAPRTLAHVRVAMRGWAVPPKLAAAFPRLAADDGGIDRVLADARERKRMTVRLDIARLPGLVPRQSRAPIDPELVLRALKIELASKTPMPAVAAVRATFTPGSLAAFTQALLDIWNAAGRPAAERWVTTFASAIGADTNHGAIDLETFAACGHDEALAIIARLERAGGDAQIQTLFALAESWTPRAPRRAAAAAALARIARARGTLLPRLLDETCPDIAPHDLGACVELAQRSWLEQLMMTGRRVRFAAFESPLRRAAADQLVLAVHQAPVAVAWFAGGVATSHDGPVMLDPEVKVGVVHPAMPGGLDLAPLRALDLSPQIEQLARPTYAPLASELHTQTITRFATRPASVGRLAAILEPHGWEADARAEGTGLPHAFTKVFGVAPAIRATAHVATGAIERVTFDGRLEKLSPIAISELLYELDRATR